MTTSWIGFKNTEDLGDGLRATFNLTLLFRANNGSAGRFDGNETLFSHDANGGLIGNLGAIWLGRDLTPNLLPPILFNPFGYSFRSEYRQQHRIGYPSPFLIVARAGKTVASTTYAR